jgi:endonuclease-3
MPKALSKLVQIRKARVDAILPILKSSYPDAKCRLDFQTPFQLIVATILSAQCTDDRVNIVTKTLFKKYKTPRALAESPADELEGIIQSTGFFRAKAKSLRAMAAALVADHGGEVPKSMDELVVLAGVGRKTANVVLGNAYGMNEGITVDTHVGRLGLRLGLTRHTDAVKVEQDLIPLVPRHDWTLWSHLLIFHGRAVCQARKPRCHQCQLLKCCPSGPSLIRSGVAAKAE